MLNNTKSATAGHPVYDSVEMIEMLMPGDAKSVPVRRATPQHRQEFDSAYKAFKAGIEFQGDGLPLNQWPGIAIGQIQSLAAMKCYTVEHLAGLRDSTISANNAIGLRELREKAISYLEAAKGMAPIAALVASNEELKKMLIASNETQAEQNKMIIGLQARLDAQTQPKTPDAIPVFKSADKGK